jgi:ABC-type Mn2+/Zn2+ transport system permease subunit
MTFTPELIQTFVTALFVSIAAGLLGSFVILKRMSLAGDALSHVALPGIALALLLHLNPFVGAFSTLFIAVVGIWYLKYQTTLSTDTLIGIFFTASLALGFLFIPNQDILEALFGNIATLSLTDSIISIALSLAIVGTLLAIHKKLALNMFSEELSHSIGINNKRLDFIFLFLFALTVALGIRFVGSLLMGALVIIPAASAKNISRSLKGFMSLSVIFAILSTIGGVILSQLLHVASGPLFILSSVALFIVSLVIRKLR